MRFKNVIHSWHCKCRRPEDFYQSKLPAPATCLILLSASRHGCYRTRGVACSHVSMRAVRTSVGIIVAHLHQEGSDEQSPTQAAQKIMREARPVNAMGSRAHKLLYADTCDAMPINIAYACLITVACNVVVAASRERLESELATKRLRTQSNVSGQHCCSKR